MEDEEFWHWMLEKEYPLMVEKKPIFQSYKNFYLYLQRLIYLLEKDFNYIFTRENTEFPDTLYHKLKYNIPPYTENINELGAKYALHNCQNNVC